MKALKILLYLHPVLILALFAAICHHRILQAVDRCVDEQEKSKQALHMGPDEPTLPDELKQKRFEFRCPEDMAVILGGTLQVPGGPDPADQPPRPQTMTTFCMDVYEYPNKKFQVPMVGMTFLEAERFCIEAGKRLCTEDEWLFACVGGKNRSYSYGESFQPWRCNTNGLQPGACAGIAPSGSHPGCHNEFGVYDLNGNVSEWVTSREGMEDDYAVMGGTAWPAEYGQSCFSRHTHPLRDSHYCDDGFRCCRQAQ